ncbi:tumor necrosis factor receptor superfamily member 5-like isoform X1, partial [Clarias magur]
VYSVLTCGAECGPSEYLSPSGDCCSMCNIGSVVSKDCSGDYRTSCKPCSEGTFMNRPNGLDMCLQCKVCGRGFSILRECTKIQDTVCEVSDGYYCLDYRDGECIRAVEHSKCTPGQHIKTPGTKASDTVCEACPPGFYSPKGVNCTKWTDCSDNNEIEDQEGTSITDVKCKPKGKRYDLLGFLWNLFGSQKVNQTCITIQESVSILSSQMEINVGKVNIYPPLENVVLCVMWGRWFLKTAVVITVQHANLALKEHSLMNLMDFISVSHAKFVAQ